MTSNKIILNTVDILLSVVALLLAVLVRFGFSELNDISFYYSKTTGISFIIYILVVHFSSHLVGVYDFDRMYKKRDIIINILFGIITIFAVLSMVYFYLDPFAKLGRGVLLGTIALFGILQISWHIAFLVLLKYKHFSHRILMLGSGPLAAQIGDMISDSRNLKVIGYVSCAEFQFKRANSPEPVAPGVSEEKIITSAENLAEHAMKNKIDTVVVALTDRRGTLPHGEVLKCKLNGITIMDAPAVYELIFSKILIEQITPSWFIFSDGFNKTHAFNTCKRVVDIFVSLTGLLLVLPFIPLIAIAIKLDSHGPVIFRQERVGLNKMFTLYKFRTMCQNAEEGSGATWATRNDPRVTRLGRFLRKCRVDEIPQLYNVLRGDMSFVGPRPERPEFVENLNEVISHYAMRHLVKPGLTGWAQVRYPYGSSVQDSIEKLRYDLYYIKNSSPFLDTLVFFETIKVVLLGRGGQ